MTPDEKITLNESMNGCSSWENLPEKTKAANWIKWATDHNWSDITYSSATKTVPKCTVGQHYPGSANWLVTDKVINVQKGVVLLLVAAHNTKGDNKVNYLLQWDKQNKIWLGVGSYSTHQGPDLLVDSPAKPEAYQPVVKEIDPEFEKLLQEEEKIEKKAAEKAALKALHPWARHAKEHWTIESDENQMAAHLATLHTGEKVGTSTLTGFLAADPTDTSPGQIYMMLLDSPDGIMNVLIQGCGGGGGWIGLGHSTDASTCVYLKPGDKPETIAKRIKDLKNYLKPYIQKQAWHAFADYKQWEPVTEVEALQCKGLKKGDKYPLPAVTDKVLPTNYVSNAEVRGHQIHKLTNGDSYHLYYINHSFLGRENLLLKRTKKGEWSGIGRGFAPQGKGTANLLYYMTGQTKAGTLKRAKDYTPKNKQFEYKEGAKPPVKKEDSVTGTHPWLYYAVEKKWAGGILPFHTTQATQIGDWTVLGVAHSPNSDGSIYTMYLLYNGYQSKWMNELHHTGPGGKSNAIMGSHVAKIAMVLPYSTQTMTPKDITDKCNGLLGHDVPKTAPTVPDLGPVQGFEKTGWNTPGGGDLEVTKGIVKDHQTAVFLDVSQQGDKKKNYNERIARLAGSFNHDQTIKADVYVIVNGHIIPYKSNWKKMEKSGEKVPASGLSGWAQDKGYAMFVISAPAGKSVG